MALVPINVGFIVNDGTGDDLRTAFIKINQNFEELELLGGQANTISNIGTGIGLYKEKIGVDLRLKSLKAGSGINISGNPTEVLIENTRNVIVTVNANTGSVTASTTSQAINIVGGNGILTSISGNTLTIDGIGGLVDDDNPTLSANLNANNFNINNVGSISVQTVSATGIISADNLVSNNVNVGGNINVSGNITATDLQSTVYGVDIREIQSVFYIFDFGFINPEFTSPVPFLLHTIAIDMGTINDPANLGINGGTLV